MKGISSMTMASFAVMSWMSLKQLKAWAMNLSCTLKQFCHLTRENCGNKLAGKPSRCRLGMLDILFEGGSLQYIVLHKIPLGAGCPGSKMTKEHKGWMNKISWECTWCISYESVNRSMQNLPLIFSVLDIFLPHLLFDLCQCSEVCHWKDTKLLKQILKRQSPRCCTWRISIKLWWPTAGQLPSWVYSINIQQCQLNHIHLHWAQNSFYQ